MLTTPEKILFLLAALASVYAAYQVAVRIVRTIARGQGKIDGMFVPRGLLSVLLKTISFQPVFRARFWPSLFHGLVAWGFIYYLLVNLGYVLEGYIPEFVFLGQGLVGDLYRLMADLISVGALVGMVALILRRFVLNPPGLRARDDILLHPKSRLGIRRDSAIV